MMPPKGNHWWDAFHKLIFAIQNCMVGEGCDQRCCSMFDPRESSWNLNLSGLHVAMIQTRTTKMAKARTETLLPSIVLVGFHRGLYHGRVFPNWVHPWTSDHFHNPAVAQMILSVLIGSHPSFRTLTGHLTSSLPRTQKERKKVSQRIWPRVNNEDPIYPWQVQAPFHWKVQNDP